MHLQQLGNYPDLDLVISFLWKIISPAHSCPTSISGDSWSASISGAPGQQTLTLHATASRRMGNADGVTSLFLVLLLLAGVKGGSIRRDVPQPGVIRDIVMTI
jgi:hypothetical protein